jgi:photosystem II stability/assembly factor-like uncharacterized protein
MLSCGGAGVLVIPVELARWLNQGRVPTSSTLRAVRFVNDVQGIVVGDSSSIYRTDDGGTTWTQLTHTPYASGGDIAGLDIEGSELLAVGADLAGTSGRLWSSTDALNWAATDAPVSPFVAVDLIDASLAFGSGVLSYALRANGTVRAAHPLQAPPVVEGPSGFGGTPLALDAEETGEIAVVGSGGNLRMYTPATSSWGNLALGTAETMRRVQLFASTQVFTCGDNGTVCFTDDWTTALAPVAFTSGGTIPGVQLRGMHFPGGPDVGWVVGAGGTIRKITGVYNAMTDTWSFSWAAQAPPAAAAGINFNDVFFVDDSIGYIVGELGTVLKTTNGGTTWTTAPAAGQGALVTLRGVDFTSDGVNGLAVGDNGTVLRTMNSGQTWTAFATGVPGGQTVRGVSICRAGTNNVAMICGDGGFVRRNLDVWGTGVWEAPTNAVPAVNYYAVVMPVTDNTAVFVGNRPAGPGPSATILATSTGDLAGASWVWKMQSVPVLATDLRTVVAFVDTITGDVDFIAGGTGGKILFNTLTGIFAIAGALPWTNITPGTFPTDDILSIAARTENILYTAHGNANVRRIFLPTGVTPVWETTSALPGATAVNAVASFGDGYVFAVGTGSTGSRIWTTTNGGIAMPAPVTWLLSPVHTKETLNAVWRMDPTGQMGFAVGTNGTILATFVGGQ